MNRPKDKTRGDEQREARLRAALRANLARRKAQARARAEDKESPVQVDDKAANRGEDS